MNFSNQIDLHGLKITLKFSYGMEELKSKKDELLDKAIELINNN